MEGGTWRNGERSRFEVKLGDSEEFWGWWRYILVCEVGEVCEKRGKME